MAAWEPEFGNSFGEGADFGRRRQDDATTVARQQQGTTGGFSLHRFEVRRTFETDDGGREHTGITRCATSPLETDAGRWDNTVDGKMAAPAAKTWKGLPRGTINTVTIKFPMDERRLHCDVAGYHIALKI